MGSPMETSATKSCITCKDNKHPEVCGLEDLGKLWEFEVFSGLKNFWNWDMGSHRARVTYAVYPEEKPQAHSSRVGPSAPVTGMVVKKGGSREAIALIALFLGGGSG